MVPAESHKLNDGGSNPLLATNKPFLEILNLARLKCWKISEIFILSHLEKFKNYKANRNFELTEVRILLSPQIQYLLELFILDTQTLY